MRISIALCTYNGEKYIREQLISLLNQTILPDEIIVCDDNSTDDTVSIINTFSNENQFNIFVNTKNIGTIKNFEKAISLTTGDIIFLSDQDDIWYPDKIEKMINAFDNNLGNLLVFSNGDLIDGNGVLIGSTLWDKWDFNLEIRKNWKNNELAFNDLFKNNNKVTGATVAFCKELKNNILPINIPFEYWHDVWIALHASGLNGLHFIEESLIQYRIHSNQQIGIPESNNILDNSHNFRDSISYEEFYNLIFEKYPNKSKVFFVNEVISLTKEVNRLKKELKATRHSKAYRVGKFILKPFSYIRNLVVDKHE